MGRPPSNGGPSFRFNQAEIAEMEAILQAHKTAMPARELLVTLAEKFSNSEERSGKIEVQMKQVWNWFQNRRYAIRAKAGKSPGKLYTTHMTQHDSTMVKGVPQVTQPLAASSAIVRPLPQAPQHPTGPSATIRTFPQASQHPAGFSVQSAGRVAENSQMEYEAKSARDGAWYDVSTFLSHRSLETGDPEVLVRFAGFGAEEDEWVNIRKNVRQRSLPCESSECVAVLPADLILCFQEGKEQALYFDAHVLDAQRRRHDVRGCRCRFLVRYDHDQSEEIVALRKICRRPETDYRLQQLHAINENKNVANNIHTVSTLRVYPPAEVQVKQHKVEPMVQPSQAENRQKCHKVDSTPPPEGSRTHLKVEPVVLPPPGYVPQNQYKVQPAEPAPPPEVPQDQHKVQAAVPAPLPEVPPDQHKVQPLLPASSIEPLVEPEKVEPEPMVPVPSAEEQRVEPVAPTRDEVQVELHEVQPVMADTSTEASVEPHKVETVRLSSDEANQELQTVGPREEPEPHKEPVVSGSSVEVPAELHEVQSVVPDQPTIKTDPDEPMVPVPTDDQPPKPMEVMDGNGGNVNEDTHAENAGSDEVVPPENADLLPENVDLPPENAGLLPENVNLPPENVDCPPENAGLLPENASVASSDVAGEMEEG